MKGRPTSGRETRWARGSPPAEGAEAAPGRKEDRLRKRLASLVMCLTAAALLLPAAPASATTCVILPEPDVGDVYCLLYGTPGVNQVCAKLPVC